MRREHWAALMVVALAGLAARAADGPAPGTIVTIAGYGQYGFSGDGGPAAAAQLWCPRGLAVDREGNLFIADCWNQRVRKVTPGGTITTVAGSGAAGFDAGAFAGDGGPAAQARLNGPQSVAVDGAGNLFIADFRNHRVRKVSPTGIITTVAATGKQGFSGKGGPASRAMLSGPTGVAVDGEGNLFITDIHLDRVQKVSLKGTITTVAGGGTGELRDDNPATAAVFRVPIGIAVDGAGALFIADQNKHRIRKVSPNGTITTVAGTGEPGFSGDGGPATKARMKYPTAVAVDRAGNLFIADSGNGRIRKVSPDGVIRTAAGGGTAVPGDGGPATAAALDPFGLAVDGQGSLLIADNRGSRIRKVLGVAAPGLLPDKSP